MIDVPALMVRPYVLHVTARNTAGDTSDVEVPFRIGSRSSASAFNSNARSTDALAAPQAPENSEPLPQP